MHHEQNIKAAASTVAILVVCASPRKHQRSTCVPPDPGNVHEQHRPESTEENRAKLLSEPLKRKKCLASGGLASLRNGVSLLKVNAQKQKN